MREPAKYQKIQFFDTRIYDICQRRFSLACALQDRDKGLLTPDHLIWSCRNMRKIDTRIPKIEENKTFTGTHAPQIDCTKFGKFVWKGGRSVGKVRIFDTRIGKIMRFSLIFMRIRAQVRILAHAYERVMRQRMDTGDFSL